MSYTTVSAVKSYLNISGTGDDALLEALITRAQAIIDAWCGRTFEAVTGTRYYTLDDVRGQLLIVDEDLLSVTALVNGDGTEIASGDYWLWPRNVTPHWGILLKSTLGWEQDVDMYITVAGSWGYATTAPADIVQATVRLAAYLYRQRDANVFDVTATPELGVVTVPQGMPADVRVILQPYRRVEVW